MNIVDIVNKDISANNGPDYENNIRSKMPGYNLVFEFPNCPVELEKTLAFPAYIKRVDDTFTPSFKEEPIYGRMDPIPIYSRTTREISFDLMLPSSGLLQSRDIAKKLDILVKNTYPTYQPNGNVNIISSPPLVKIFFSNIIYDQTQKDSLLGYFKGAVKISHDLSNGVFVRGEGYETYPKAYSLSFSFGVLHYYTPGYVTSGGVTKNSVNILQRNR